MKKINVRVQLELSKKLIDNELSLDQNIKLIKEIVNKHNLNGTYLNGIINIYEKTRNIRLKDNVFNDILTNSMNLQEKYEAMKLEVQIYNKQLDKFNLSMNIKETSKIGMLNFIKTYDDKVVTYLKVSVNSSLNYLTEEDKRQYMRSYFGILLNSSERFNYFQLNKKLSFKNNINKVKEQIKEYENKDDDLSKSLIKGLESDIRMFEKKEKEVQHQRMGVLAIINDSIDEMIEMINNINWMSKEVRAEVVTDNDFNYILDQTIYKNQYTQSSVCGSYFYDEYNEEYGRVVSIQQFEKIQREFYMKPIAEIEENLDGLATAVCAMSVLKEDNTKAKELVQKGISEMSQRHKFDNSIDGQFEQVEARQYLSNLYESLRSDTSETILDCEIKIILRSKTYEELEKATRKVNVVLASIGKCNVRKFDVVNDIYKSAYTKNVQLTNPIELTLSLFAIGLPYNYIIVDDPDGSFKNISKDELLCFNYFYKPNAERSLSSGVLFGMPGSGKSTEMKEMIKNHFLQNGITYVVDQDSEFINLVKALGGKNIIFGDDKHYINPLELYAVDEYSEDNFQKLVENQVNFVSSILGSLYKENYKYLREKLENILFIMYDKYKYEQFTFSEVLEETKLHYKEQDIPEIQVKYLDLIELLENLKHKFKIFNNFTNIQLDSDLINFDISSVKDNEQLLNTLMIVIFDFLNRKMVNNRLNSKLSKEMQKLEAITKINNQTDEYEKEYLEQLDQLQLNHLYESVQPNIMILIDEAHRMFTNSNVMKYLIRTVRESRKYQTALWFATQRFQDFFKEEILSDVTTLYDMLAYKILLYQKSDQVEFVADKIRLTESQKVAITQANAVEPQKGKGLMVVGEKVFNFNNKISPEWLAIFGGGK